MPGADAASLLGRSGLFHARLCARACARACADCVPCRLIRSRVSNPVCGEGTRSDALRSCTLHVEEVTALSCMPRHDILSRGVFDCPRSNIELGCRPRRACRLPRLQRLRASTTLALDIAAATLLACCACPFQDGHQTRSAQRWFVDNAQVGIGAVGAARVQVTVAHALWSLALLQVEIGIGNSPSSSHKSARRARRQQRMPLKEMCSPCAPRGGPGLTVSWHPQASAIHKCS